MNVTYTHATNLSGSGIGSIAAHFVRAIQRAGHLQQAIAAYGRLPDIPPHQLRTFPWMTLVARLARDNAPWRDAIFDRTASFFIPECDIFHGWSHQCLYSLKAAKARGAVTFVERQNSHDRVQYQLVQAEFERWGFSGHEPVRGWGMQRGLAEYALTDFFTVPSPFVYDSMIAQGISAEQLFLVPYGVDITQFTPGAPPTDVFRLLYVGRVSLRKGIPYLLQAWRRLNLPRAELWIAGRVTADAETVIAPYQQDPTIRFLGHVRESADLYRRASAFAFPSIEEGSALVTYEAMAAGLPMIFTYNSGAVARSGVEGIQVPIRDVDALAEAIERLYRSPALRREIGQAARQRAAAYTWEAAGQHLLTAYETGLNRQLAVQS